MKVNWIFFAIFTMLLSCKSKDTKSSINSYGHYIDGYGIGLNGVLKDTARTLRIYFDNSKFRMIDHVTVTEYDDSGNVRKETVAERNITHDKDEYASEDKDESLNVVRDDTLSYYKDIKETVESETVTEINGLSFGERLLRLASVLSAGFLLGLLVRRKISD